MKDVGEAKGFEKLSRNRGQYCVNFSERKDNNRM